MTILTLDQRRKSLHTVEEPALGDRLQGFVVTVGGEQTDGGQQPGGHQSHHRPVSQDRSADSLTL